MRYGRFIPMDFLFENMASSYLIPFHFSSPASQNQQMRGIPLDRPGHSACDLELQVSSCGPNTLVTSRSISQSYQSRIDIINPFHPGLNLIDQPSHLRLIKHPLPFALRLSLGANICHRSPQPHRCAELAGISHHVAINVSTIGTYPEWPTFGCTLLQFPI